MTSHFNKNKIQSTTKVILFKLKNFGSWPIKVTYTFKILIFLLKTKDCITRDIKFRGEVRLIK